MANSIELENELKLRFVSMRGIKPPPTMYIGMFAGDTKPKPFQRKRPNLSNLPNGKLPSLHDMRTLALQLQKGSYRPCPPGSSRRIDLALQHIYEGCNTFALLNVKGSPGIANQWRFESIIEITDDKIVFKPNGLLNAGPTVEFCYEDIAEWNAIDNDHMRLNDSGVEIRSIAGDCVFFGVTYIRDVKHTLEFYWNNYQVANGRPTKLGSTHGRPILSITTLSGESTNVEDAQFGSSDVVDQDNIVVRPGSKIATKRSSIDSFLSSPKEMSVVPSENRKVKKHWHQIVMHQGWLLKKGGIGIGAAKSWIKRYFVLYKTSQGHFLVYYSDFTECPLYSLEKNHRNIVDLSKATFIRPGSSKCDTDVPPHSFDIVTTEREWTLCAETHENVAKWLKIITRAVDEDVAILPDEDLLFKVKPINPPNTLLPSTDYTTSLKVCSNGVSVTIPEGKDNLEKEIFFWVYTDFYKWLLTAHGGKYALQVNVFTDSSFSRRDEYNFRNKEAIRLATAIEFFIEKFMSVMHIRLETMEVTEQPSQNDNTNLHKVSNEEWTDNIATPVPEVDLLDMNPEVTSMSPTYGHVATSDLYQQQSHSIAATSVDPFGGDPFGEDPFSSSIAPATTASKLAPPLTPIQQTQHQIWFHSIVYSKSGPFYDDSNLQLAIKIEIRGSQARVAFHYRNQSPAEISKLDISIQDTAGLLRFQFSDVPDTIAAIKQGQFSLMVECMKPTHPGPTLSVSYNHALVGRVSNTVALPVTVVSFNEQLPMPATDFMAKWPQLNAPGQEIIEVFNPSRRIDPMMLKQALTAAFGFADIVGTPDGSSNILYGASSLKTGATAPNGQKINIGCLVKLELHEQTNAIRITCRTLHPAATSSILSTVKALIG